MPDVERPFDSILMPKATLEQFPCDCSGVTHRVDATEVTPEVDALPDSWIEALRRGVLGRCPACGCANLFEAFLKPRASCPCCGQDWSHQRADDFPPYIVILLMGHVLVPGMIVVETMFHPPLWVQLSLWLPLVVILSIGLLQPAKGGVIAYQWWHGMGGFETRRRRPSV